MEKKQPKMEFVGTLIMTQQGDHDEPIYVWCHKGQGDRVRAAILPQAVAVAATKKPVARRARPRNMWVVDVHKLSSAHILFVVR